MTSKNLPATRTNLPSPTVPSTLEAKFTKVERDAYNARFSVVLKEYSFDEACVEVGKALNICMELVGILTDRRPSHAAKVEIADYVVKNYGFLSPQEIKLAFTVAMTMFEPGTKDKPSIIDHYQSFSIPYLNGILNNYRRWRYDVTNKIEEAIVVDEELKHVSERYLRNNDILKAVIYRSFYETINGFDVSYPGSLNKHFLFCMSINLNVCTEEDMEFFIDAADAEIKEMYEQFGYDEKGVKKRGANDNFDLTAFIQPMNKTERARTIAMKAWFKNLADKKVPFTRFYTYIENKACYLCPETTKDLREKRLASKSYGNRKK